MRPARPKLFRSATHTALIVAVAVPSVVAACAEEGETPTCPPQVLYDYTEPDASNDPDVARARAAGVDAGCLTPTGTATSGTIQTPAGGNSGRGGGTSGGSGGKGGKGGSGGSNAAAGAGGV
jgi:hypothetical protein